MYDVFIKVTLTGGDQKTQIIKEFTYSFDKLSDATEKYFEKIGELAKDVACYEGKLYARLTQGADFFYEFRATGY